VGRASLRGAAEAGVLSWLLRSLGGGVLVVLLVALALLASMAAGPSRRPEQYEPPSCRLVPSRAGAWSDATCLRAPARHQAWRRHARTEDH
jgi:hypothetical protein